MAGINWQYFLLGFAALIINITVHEFGHAIAAVRAGDDTPKMQGRISLNPIDHLDPIGTIMMVITMINGYGIGWGKPVIVNPMNFRSPRWDNFRVSFQGPLHNLILAAIVGIIFRFVDIMPLSPAYVFVKALVVSGIFLALFNLIPIGPLDGSHILSSLLPIEKAREYDRFNSQYGTIIMLALVLVGGSILSAILIVPARLLYTLFTGSSL